MGWEEAQEYTLFLHLPLVGTIHQTDLNADEVVEYAHEYGINIDYERLPVRPGGVIAGTDWEVQWPREDGTVGEVVR